jgi:hypothetical protein
VHQRPTALLAMAFVTVSALGVSAVAAGGLLGSPDVHHTHSAAAE